LVPYNYHIHLDRCPTVGVVAVGFVAGNRAVAWSAPGDVCHHASVVARGVAGSRRRQIRLFGEAGVVNHRIRKTAMTEGDMRIGAGGIETNYEVTGEGASLVLIHGFTDNLNMWFNQVPVFSRRFKVLTYDLRGHGKTEIPEGRFSMEIFADDLRALLEALDVEKACVLGYSMGGRIGLEFALRYPQMTTGLVFANSGVRGSRVQATAEQIAELVERRKQMVELFETGDIEVVADGMAERSFSPGFRDGNPAEFQKFKDIKLQNDPGHYLAIMQAMVEAVTNPPDLTQLGCPALIIAGERDGFMALDEAKSMEQAISDVTVTILPTGHAAAIEAPQAFNQAVLDFVGRL
jgi:pimeloyl-ACP methyl ester carboxylesterase